MPSLKIRSLHLKGFQQFEDTVLDFTDPATGQAADRICLIGANGTGKSTVLGLLNSLALPAAFMPRPELPPEVQCVLECGGQRTRVGLLEKNPRDIEGRAEPLTQRRFAAYRPSVAKRSSRTATTLPGVGRGPQTEPLRADFVVVSPAEASTNPGMSLRGPPKTDLDTAIGQSKLIDNPRHVVSTATVVEMWSNLIGALHRRREARERFERLPENLQRTKADLIASFDEGYPDPLLGLALLWDRILGPAGLAFDAAGAKIPFQLKDNLEAHVRIKATGEPIAFGALSTGMRNFLFRVGHLYLLFFQREFERGFVFIDEPENSLFPDFLFTLMEIYEEILRPHPVQLFVATHNPIVAAQFHPHERVVLEWEDGQVVARKGTAPKGDDPNDLLRKDFGLPEVMGPEGRKKWKEYQDLRKQLRRATDPAEKVALLEKAAAIGRDYGFEP